MELEIECKTEMLSKAFRHAEIHIHRTQVRILPVTDEDPRLGTRAAKFDLEDCWIIRIGNAGLTKTFHAKTYGEVVRLALAFNRTKVVRK